MKNICIVILLLISAQVVAGTRTVYVDTDAGGAGTGADWTNAYTSQAAAIAGEITNGADLVTEQNDLDVYFRASSGTADTTQAVWDGFSTSETYDIELIMDGTNGSDKHDGTWCDTKYRLEVSNAYPFLCKDDHVSVDGMQVRTPAIDGPDHVVFCNYQSAGAILEFERLIVRGADDGSNEQYGIVTVGANADVYISNCTVYDMNTAVAGTYGIKADGDEAFLTNCTVVGGARGIVDAAPASRGTAVTNCMAIDAASYCFYTGGSWDANSTNNLSDDATAPGSNPVKNVEPTFVDKDNHDYHLASNDDKAKDAGADMDPDPNGLYSIEVDIDGDDRDTVGGGTWDIGADEYDTTGGGGPSLMIIDHYRRQH